MKIQLSFRILISSLFLSLFIGIQAQATPKIGVFRGWESNLGFWDYSTNSKVSGVGGADQIAAYEQWLGRPMDYASDAMSLQSWADMNGVGCSTWKDGGCGFTYLKNWAPYNTRAIFQVNMLGDVGQIPKATVDPINCTATNTCTPLNPSGLDDRVSAALQLGSDASLCTQQRAAQGLCIIQSGLKCSPSDSAEGLCVGAYDAYWNSLRTSLLSNGFKNVTLRIGWEMNGFWYSHRAFDNPSAWVAYYKHIVRILRGTDSSNPANGASDNHFQFNWNLALDPGQVAAPGISGSAIVIDPSKIYPADDSKGYSYVDQIGIDAYFDSNANYSWYGCGVGGQCLVPPLASASWSATQLNIMSGQQINHGWGVPYNDPFAPNLDSSGKPIPLGILQVSAFAKLKNKPLSFPEFGLYYGQWPNNWNFSNLGTAPAAAFIGGPYDNAYYFQMFYDWINDPTNNVLFANYFDNPGVDNLGPHSICNMCDSQDTSPVGEAVATAWPVAAQAFRQLFGPGIMDGNKVAINAATSTNFNVTLGNSFTATYNLSQMPNNLVSQDYSLFVDFLYHDPDKKTDSLAYSDTSQVIKNMAQQSASISVPITSSISSSAFRGGTYSIVSGLYFPRYENSATGGLPIKSRAMIPVNAGTGGASNYTSLLGSYNYSSATQTFQTGIQVGTLIVMDPNACLLSGSGFNYKTGETATGYAASSVPYGQACASAQVTCGNAGWSNTNYKYATCVVQAPTAVNDANIVTVNALNPSSASVKVGNSVNVSFSFTIAAGKHLAESYSAFAWVLDGNNQFSDTLPGYWIPNANLTPSSTGTLTFAGSIPVSTMVRAANYKIFVGLNDASNKSPALNAGAGATAVSGFSAIQVGTLNVTDPNACLLSGSSYEYESGETAPSSFNSQTVAYGNTCQSIATNKCANGAWSSPSYSFSSCTVSPPVSCALNGQTIANGSSINEYLSATVPYGSTCTSQARVCTNGTLSGTYTNASCTVSAPIPCTLSGQTIANGSSVNEYASATVPYGSTCGAPQNRVCTNGTLSGTYTSATCTVAAGASCTLAGQTIASGGTLMAYLKGSVPSGGACLSQLRTCTNGTLSGTYTFLDCTQGSQNGNL